MLVSVVAFTANSLLLRYFSGSGKGVSPDVAMFFRAGIGMIMVFFLFRGRRPTRVVPIFRERLLILRGLTGLLGTAVYYWTVPSLGAGMATLICNTYVIFASVIAVLAPGEKLTPARFTWLSLAFAGIALLIGPCNGSQDGFSLGWYEVVAIAGAILAASSVVLVRQLTLKHSIGTIYLAQCVWILIPVGITALPQLSGLGMMDIFLLLLAGSMAGSGQLMMNEGYRCLPVSKGASIQMLWPVTTATGGWLLFAETLTLLQIAGAILVLASIWMVSIRPVSIREKR